MKLNIVALAISVEKLIFTNFYAFLCFMPWVKGLIAGQKISILLKGLRKWSLDGPYFA